MSAGATMGLADLWTAAGILVGFQVAALTLRIRREMDVGDAKEVTWLPPSDWLNLLSFCLTLVGVFVGPILDLWTPSAALKIFGFAVLLLAGYPFALAGHYELFDHHHPRAARYFPAQEKLCILLVGVAAVGYIILAVAR